MKITSDIINDLLPLYAADECSADTRRLVDEYLRQNPREAAEFKVIMQTPLPRDLPSPASLDEAQALREARRRLNRQKWLMAVAIFCSLSPLSFFYDNGHTWWLLRDSPGSAMVYVVLAVIFWAVYVRERRQPHNL